MTKHQMASLVTKVGSWFDGTIMLNFDPRDFQTDPGMRQWIDRYTKEYGTFDEAGCYPINGWWILKDAIEKTKSVDVEVLRKYVANGHRPVLTMEGYAQLFARPDLSNFRTIDVAAGLPLGMVKNGKLGFYKLVGVKDQYLSTIKVLGQTDVYKKYWEKYGKPIFPPEKAEVDFADLDK
jgi:hypothetical protein